MKFVQRDRTRSTRDSLPTYLITGANRGLGLAMTRVALERGSRVHATARRPEKADALHRLVALHPGRLEIHRLELSTPRDREALAGTLAARDDWIDVLINNAAIYVRSPEVAPVESHREIAAVREDTMRRTFEVNTMAPLLLTQSVLPRIPRHSGARIAFLSSGMASIERKEGEIEYSYSASKVALNMLARVLSIELEPRDIRVVALNPGWVATDMGTRAAPLEPAPVARGLIDVIASIQPSESGSFLDHEGRRVPW